LTEVELGQATATDDSGILSSLVNDWPGGGFPLGDTIVTWTATDPTGKMGIDTQKVTVFIDDEDINFIDGFECE